MQTKTEKLESTSLNLQTISYTESMELNWFASETSADVLSTKPKPKEEKNP